MSGVWSGKLLILLGWVVLYFVHSSELDPLAVLQDHEPAMQSSMSQIQMGFPVK